MKSLVNLERRGAQTWVWLDRPERHNAVNGPLAEALDAGLAEALDDPGTRLVVLAGRGRTFCSGLDLDGHGEAFRRAPGASLSPFQSVVARLMETDKPVVARVQGGAFGAGFCLVVCCGLAIVEQGTRFAVTELRFGLPSTMIPLVLHHTGRLGAARHVLMSGTPFDTGFALAAALVHRVVPAGELDAAVAEACGELTACAPEAYGAARELQRRLPTLGFRDGLTLCGEVLERSLDGEECREALEARRAKRPPRWAAPPGA